MSKSTLSIIVREAANLHSPNFSTRTVEVPCRLPDSFNFKFHDFHTTLRAVAYLSGCDNPATASVSDVELVQGPDIECSKLMHELAEACLWRAQAYLGIGDPLPAGSPLPAIATAYEAEVAAYAAGVLAYHELPRRLFSMALVPTHPSESAMSPAVLMLAKYVEYVFEQACAAQTERAEVQAKVTPIRTVTP